MESILLSNVAAIIAKDVLIDKSKETEDFRKSATFKYPLLASDDDEDFNFFLRQQKLCGLQPRSGDILPILHTTNYPASKEHLKRSCDKDKAWRSANSSCNKYQKQIDVNLLNMFNENEFESYLHMNKMTFLGLFRSLRKYLRPADLPRNTPPQSVYSLAIWKLTTDEHFEQISRKFCIPTGICQQVIRLFWRRISAQYESLIHWPNTMQKRERNMLNFQRNSKQNTFQHIFGVVALKRLDVFLEAENQDIAVILQIVCDADQKVIDCFLELEADYSFDASPIGQMLALNIQTLPLQSYLVGDTHFPLKPYLIRPYGKACDNREKVFNEVLEPILNIGQQVLDAMAKRFNSLYALEARNLQEVRKIVDTVCGLHNLCIGMEDDYVERTNEETRFHWANVSAEDEIKIAAAEQNEQGRQKRDALLAVLMSN